MRVADQGGGGGVRATEDGRGENHERTHPEGRERRADERARAGDTRCLLRRGRHVGGLICGGFVEVSAALRTARENYHKVSAGWKPPGSQASGGPAPMMSGTGLCSRGRAKVRATVATTITPNPIHMVRPL